MLDRQVDNFLREFFCQTCGLFLLFLSLWSLLDPSRGPFLNLIAAAGQIAIVFVPVFVFVFVSVSVFVSVFGICICICISFLPISHISGEDLLRLVCFLQFVAGSLVRPLPNLPIFYLQYLCMIFANCIWLLHFGDIHIKTSLLNKIFG